MLFQTKDLTKKFGGLTAVSNFSMTIDNGEIVGLIGPNGAGKTTVFNMITGVYKPTKGEIKFLDYDISNKKGEKNYKTDKITKLGIARTFQNIRLFSDLNVLDNVMIAHHLHLKSSLFGSVIRTFRYRKEEKEIKERSINLLKSLGLEDLIAEQAGGLAYGQQRRLEIARALATKPKLLLLDEPAAGMNPQEGKDLMKFIRDIRDDYDLTILMIEHDMKVVMGVCERMYVLDHGVTIAHGNPKEIQTNEKVIQAYLGVNASA